MLSPLSSPSISTPSVHPVHTTAVQRIALINYVIIHSKSTHLDKYLQLQATVNTVRSQVAPPLLITSVCHTHCATLLRSAMLPEYIWQLGKYYNIDLCIHICMLLFILLTKPSLTQLTAAVWRGRQQQAACCVQCGQASASGGRAAYPRTRTTQSQQLWTLRSLILI